MKIYRCKGVRLLLQEILEVMENMVDVNPMPALGRSFSPGCKQHHSNNVALGGFRAPALQQRLDHAGRRIWWTASEPHQRGRQRVTSP